MTRALLLAAALAALWLALSDVLTLDVLMDQRARLAAAYAADPAAVAAAFVLFYVLAVSLFLPTAALLTVAAGAIFGFGVGVAVIGVGSALGAALGFLLSRHLLGRRLRRHWTRTFARIDAGVEREGAFHLFALRVVPLVPFCVVNLGMGLTRMPFGRYLAVSLLGTLPSALVFVNAGAKLAAAGTAAEPLNTSLIVALCLLGLFPLAARHGVRWLRLRLA